MLDILGTEIVILDINEDDHYVKVEMSPLERGYGTTLGNSLRRVLLSSLPGSAPSSIKIEGVLHEFTVVEGVTEDVSEIVLNVKGIALKKNNDEPVSLTLDVKGPKVVTAADFQQDVEVEIANKDHYIATLNKDAHLQMEMCVINGRGYAIADQNKREDDPIGTIWIDSSFTPVKKCNFTVENTRVEQITDYDKLILEVWTNGTITPIEAISEGAQILISYLDKFSDAENYIPKAAEVEESDPYDQEKTFQMNIEELDLSLRSFNCLKRAGIDTVGDIVSRSASELSKIKNFGKKSFAEVEEKINAIGLAITEEGMDIGGPKTEPTDED